MKPGCRSGCVGDPIRGDVGITVSPAFNFIIPPEKQAVEDPGLIGVDGERDP